MPTLFRFLTVIGIIAGLGYAGLWALATFVQPEPREISVTIPASRLTR
jgi:hypothetical protein